MRRVLAVGLVALGLVTTSDVRADGGAEFVLSPEGNHLWAYDAGTGASQLLARAQNGTDPGVAAPNGMVRDINGQVCVAPDGHHLIAGEDTVVGGGDSHDPRIAGWGWFTIEGDAIGSLAIEQVGKLAPEAGVGPGYAGDPDNYGCGFLDQDRLFTTAIGNTLPGEPANGQLFLWFGPFDEGFEVVDGRFFAGTVDHCEIDVGLATAGGIAVGPDGAVHVATNRPDDQLRPGGIARYTGTWPTTVEQCTPEYLAANITRTQLVPKLPIAVPLVPHLHAITPSAVVLTPQGTMLVSSVFTGTVAEFRLDGTWKRDVFPTSPLALPGLPLGDTPYGLALTSDGSLWVADLGIVGAAPADGQGSLRRVDPAGHHTIVRAGLDFPDGLGVYRP